jgi:signal transduction histidine kinase
MLRDPDAEIRPLRTALRDLVALSTIPAAWVGREPPAIAAGLADVLVGSLNLDFAFVRLCDPRGGDPIEMTRGSGWEAFPEWLQRHLAAVGHLSHKEIIPNLGGAEPSRGIVIPIGISAEGGLVAAASDRADFPTEIDQLLLSVAANRAATAFQSARLEQELRHARNDLEIKVADRTAELRRAATYLAEAQRLSHTGSFGWNVSSGELYWSEESFRIFEYDRTTTPTVERVLQRVHPEDLALVQQTIERAAQELKDFDFEHRLVMPDGSVKYVHVVAHAVSDRSDSIEFVGAVMNVTERRRAEEALEDLAGRLIRAQEEERRRVGRELHDHISQTLGVLTIMIDQLRADQTITPGAADALEELRQKTSDITDDVHRLSHRLHSSTLDYLGLVPALQKLVSEFSERHGIAMTLTHASVPSSLPSEVALCLFRVAEESLTNVAKHSQAPSATVHVASTRDGIHLTVEDAGTGFDVATCGSRAGLGFVSMQERLRVLHGTIRVDSAPSRGTRIDAWVPAKMLANAHHEVAQRSETVRTEQQPWCS